MGRYDDPPRGPDDVTPADTVFRRGEDVQIVHGPGQETRIPADKFYDDDE